MKKATNIILIKSFAFFLHVCMQKQPSLKVHLTTFNHSIVSKGKDEPSATISFVVRVKTLLSTKTWGRSVISDRGLQLNCGKWIRTPSKQKTNQESI